MDTAFSISSINLETPAGRMLKKLAAILPPERRYDITVFGSAPLQITVDPTLLSADVDLFSDSEDVDHCQAGGFGDGPGGFLHSGLLGPGFSHQPEVGDADPSSRGRQLQVPFPAPL